MAAPVVGAAPYIPERDHIVWLDCDPTLGHEQAGRRPVLVLSPAAYNRHRMMLAVPITTNPRPKWPFMVAITVEAGRSSFAIADQVKSVDWRARDIAFIRRADLTEAGRVRGLIRQLV